MAKPITLANTGVPIQEHPLSHPGDYQGSSSLARGTDNLQASLFGFAKAFGDITGFDTLTEWGEDGVVRNLEEAALNPARIRSYDDVDSLADFGTFVIETLGEQAPQLGLDIGIAVGLTAVSKNPIAGLRSVAVRRAAADKMKAAAFGKAVKRKTREQAFSNFLTRRGAVAAAGVGLSNFMQNTGETAINFQERGIDAPGKVIAAGAFKAALDTLAPAKVFKMAEKFNVPAGQLSEVLMRSAKEAGTLALTEGGTEAVQTFVDQVAINSEDPNYDLFSAENTNEMINAALKGGIVGGAIGGGFTGATEGAAYQRRRREILAEVDNDDILKQSMATPQEGDPEPESQATIDAQARLIDDDSSSRDSVWITPGSPEPSPGILPPDIKRVVSQGGLLLTSNPEKADQLENADDEEVALSSILFDGASPRFESDGLVVVGYDREGNPVGEIATSLENVERDTATVRNIMPSGGSVRVRTANTVVAERTARNRVAAGEPVPIAGEILQELGITEDAAAEPDRVEINEQLSIAMQRAMAERFPDPEEREQAATLLMQDPDTIEDLALRRDVENMRNVLQQETLASMEMLDALEQYDDNIDEDLDDAQLGSENGAPFENGYDTEVIDYDLLRNIAVTEDEAGVRRVLDGAPVRSTQIRDESGVKNEDGAYAERDEDTFVQDTIVHAKSNAARTQNQINRRLQRYPDEQAIAERTLVTLKNNAGEDETFSAPDLTSAGLDLLRTRGVVKERENIQTPQEIRLQAFLTGLAELGQQGYQLPPRIDELGKDLIIFSSRNFNRRTGSFETLGELHQSARGASQTRNAKTDEGSLRTARNQAEQTDPSDPDFNAVQADLNRAENRQDWIIGNDPRDQTDFEGGDFAAVENTIANEGAEQDNRPRTTDRAAAVYSDNGTRGTSTPSVQGYGATVTKNDVNFVRGVLDEVGLTQIGMTVADQASVADLQAQGILSATERQRVEAGFEHANVKALFVPQGNTGVIILRDGVGGRERLAILGHEVGHAVYNSIRERVLNPATARDEMLAGKLQDAFKKDRGRADTYTGKRGFVEWFADKISARARNIVTTKPSGVVERFFASSAQTLKKTYNAIKSRLHPRFHRNQKFEDVIDAYKADNVFDNVRSIHGDGGIESIVQAADSPPVFSAREKAAMLKNFKALDPRRAPYLGALFDSDNRLKGIGYGAVAGVIYQATNSDGTTNAYHTRVDAEFGHFLSEYYKIMPRNMTRGARKRIFMQLARELPTEQLTEKARKIRELLESFHKYTTGVIPNIGTLENYFPRAYDTPAIDARSDEFIEILQSHGMTEKEAIDVADNLTQSRSVADPNSFVPKNSHLHKHRQLSDPELIKSLVDAGFLNTDPELGMVNYMRKTVRRVELERMFGGYKYLKGWTKQSRLDYIGRTGGPEAREEAESQNRAIVESYLGNNGFDMSKMTPIEAMKLANSQGHITMDGDGDPMWRDPMVRLEELLNSVSGQNVATETEYQLEQLGVAELPPEVKQRIHRNEEVKREQARRLAMHALDALPPPDHNSALYNFTGELRAYQALRTLAFSGVASIPELGTVYARNKGALNTREFADTVLNTVRNLSQMRELAEAMGTVERGMYDAMMTEMFIDTNRGKGRFFRRALPMFFKLNGNDAIVTFTRTIATSVGRQFVLTTANKVADSTPGTVEHSRAQRYLRELGVTDANTVLKWVADSELAGRDVDDTPEARIVKDAVHRFVRESVLRPNAAERPTWANHPVGGLVFNLKTFAYSHSKNVMGGLYREGSERYGEDENFRAMLPYYMAAIGVFIALGALSDEARNRVKTLGEKGTWEANRRDLDRTVFKWVDRAGFTAMPFYDAIPVPPVKDVSTFDAAFSLGPTASHLYDLFGDGNGIDKGEVLRSIPVVSQVNALRSALK